MDMTPYSDYWRQALPTYMGHWPGNLLGHIPTALIALDKREARDLLELNMVLIDSKHHELAHEAEALATASIPRQVSDKQIHDALSQYCQDRMQRLVGETAGHVHSLVNRMADAIQDLGGKIFVRLDSRSPKDSWQGHQEGFACTTAARALQLLTDSERVYEDLSAAKAQNRSVWIALRKWVDIHKEAEFRVIYNGATKAMCVSQYHYREDWKQDSPELNPVLNPIFVMQAIRNLWREVGDQILESAADGSVVFDVYVKREFDLQEFSIVNTPNGRGVDVGPSGRMWLTAHLIEINPFMEMTDPCLFNWEKDMFDKDEFRYKKDGLVVGGVL